MEDLKKIKDMLIEDNVRHLPSYALKEIWEELMEIRVSKKDKEEREILMDVWYLLRLSPRCTNIVNELLT